jgi:hypothetical protein
MYKRPKRKAYILIEVLVATSLFIMLVIAIFGIFWRTNKTSTSLNRLRVANEHMLITQATLQSLFTKASFNESVGPYFYSEIDTRSNLPSLIFTVHKIFQTSADISTNQLIKLYVEDNQLVVATFPHLKNEAGLPTLLQKNALLSNITDFKLEFFLGPDKHEDEQSAPPQEEDQEDIKKAPMGKWTDTWLSEYYRPPTLVKIELTQGKSDHFTLWFYLPFSINTIYYDKR